jgi:N-methylhydantoinase B
MEILESTFPLFIERCGLVQDSGGPGQFKGGLGTRLEMRLISPATFYSFIEKCKSPHWGSQGGKPGLKNFAVVQSKEHGEFEILKTSGIPLYAGDRVVVTAGGGGGYGSPLKRDPEMVRWDVINGYVSIECARQDYGVVIDPRTFEIDLKETELLREGQS